MQLVQLENGLVDIWPAAHSSHNAPLAEKRPALQLTQLEPSPAPDDVFPAAQLEHAESPLAEYRPAAQLTQLENGSTEVLPTVQLKH